MGRARFRFRALVIVCLGVSLAACGGDEETAVAGGNTALPISGTPSTTSDTVPTISGTPPASIAVARANGAPTISGTPAAAVVQSTGYAFAPTASDPDGDALTFSIVNRPAWASFDTATGQLSGRPESQHVGTTAGVVITVSDGVASTSLAAFDITVQAVATGSATLSWLPPTTNTDGSPLTNLAGYKVYWGPSEGDYPNSAILSNAGLTRHVIENLAPGTYFFVATAFNTAGAESGFSGVARQTIQ